MEDDLIFLENGGQPQFFDKLNMTSKKSKGTLILKKMEDQFKILEMENDTSF